MVGGGGPGPLKEEFGTVGVQHTPLVLYSGRDPGRAKLLMTPVPTEKSQVSASGS